MFSRPGHITASNWFAAQLKPNGLGLAERNLTRQGFAHFAPKRRETQRRGNRLVTQPRPLFPGYIFVQCDPTAPDARGLHSTRGLTRLIVGDPRRPQPLPEEFIAGLMMRCDKEGLLTATPALRKGDLVRVVSGPMADVISRIEEFEDGDRVRLLLELMGQKTRVSVAAEMLERLAG